MMLYGGIDWGDQTLDYQLLSEGGKVLADGRVTADVEGLAELFCVLEPHGRPEQISLAIETKHGAWMQSLLDRGYHIYPVNPKSVDNFREACSANGDKSDRIDRGVLARYMLVFRDTLRALKPDAPEIVSLRIACQDRVTRVEERTARLNELLSTLKAFYPAFLGLFGELRSAIALAFLQDFPTQDAMSKLTARRLETWLRRKSYTCMYRLAEMVAHLAAEKLPVESHLQQAKAPTIRYLAKAIAALNEEIARREREIDQAFHELPESRWVCSLPQAGPNLAPALLACLGRDQGRFESVGEARAFFGTAPVSKASGRSRIVVFRRGCWKFARRTFQLYADACRRDCPWASDLYDRLRQKGNDHHEALRVLAHKWVPILLAMQRTGTAYNEAVYQQSRRRYLLNRTQAPALN